MNVHKKIKDLRGREYSKSLPTRKEVAELPLVDEWSVVDQKMIKVPDYDELERETIQNVILICLGAYKVEDKIEGFYIQEVASFVLQGKKDTVLKDKLQKFLIEVLEYSIIRIRLSIFVIIGADKKKEEQNLGVFPGWVIAQVLEEVDIKLKQ